jgi:hypothetical protein
MRGPRNEPLRFFASDEGTRRGGTLWPPHGVSRGVCDQCVCVSTRVSLPA